MNIFKKWIENIHKARQEKREFYEYMQKTLIIDYGCGARINGVIEKLNSNYESYGITNLKIHTDFYDYTYTVSFNWNKFYFYCEGYYAKDIITKYKLPSILYDDKYWVLSAKIYYDGFQITDFKQKSDIVEVFVKSFKQHQTDAITEANEYINNLISTNIKEKTNA